jgi:hypothetical protein
MILRNTIKLGLDSEHGLPTEFRLFQRGWNNTENGRYLFDDKAAKSVMAAYANWGVDLAIDLEHQMLEVSGGAPDPTARDARGWCRLELRPDGSLWACDVKWTPDGAARLSEKRQRYISPAFEADKNTKRIIKVVNVAITAMPATHKTPALVAASANGEKGMHPELLKQALDALEKGDDKAAMEILKSLIVDAAAGDHEPDGDEPGSEGDGAEGVAPPAEVKEDKVIDPKVVDSHDEAMYGPGEEHDEDEEDEKKPEKKAERKAMRVMLRHLTDSKTFAQALSKVEQYRSSHLTLETERQKLAKERATLESAERRQLCVSLIKLGAEFPATVWADDKATTLKSRWLKMPLAELRSHVTDQKKARASKPASESSVQPPQGEIVELSAQELQICKETGADPKEFLRLKNFRNQGVDYLRNQARREAELLSRYGSGSQE